VAIVLDGEVISSPEVTSSVQCNVGIQGGRTQITGNFTRDEAQDLAVLIKGGALPVPVETISRSFVGPTLGQDAIDASFRAAVIGLDPVGGVLHDRLPAGRLPGRCSRSPRSA
jgi:SecD/SecF fusion protein